MFAHMHYRSASNIKMREHSDRQHSTLGADLYKIQSQSISECIADDMLSSAGLKGGNRCKSTRPVG